MWIISWLQGNYDRLRTVISTYYSRIISAAKNAYSWAVDKANSAYNRAKSWALSAIETVKTTLKSLIAIAQTLAWTLYHQAKSHVVEQFNKAKLLWQIAIDYASRILENFLLSKIASAWSFFRNPVDWLKGKSPLLDKIIEWFAGFVINPDSLFNKILALFDTDGKFSVWAWLQANIGRIISFFNNPLRFLMAFWKGYMLDFLQYAIAYGLGTVKYELPPFPDWDLGGFGGSVIPGNPPPAGASGLVPPVNNVYVSGYIFRPGHPGIDLGLSLGQPVFAMHDGKVTVAGWSNIGYGFYLAIQGKDWWTLYAHMEVLNVQKGDRVKAGDTVALGDSTGNSTGNHLHLEIKYKGSYIDPATVL